MQIGDLKSNLGIDKFGTAYPLQRGTKFWQIMQRARVLWLVLQLLILLFLFTHGLLRNLTLSHNSRKETTIFPMNPSSNVKLKSQTLAERSHVRMSENFSKSIVSALLTFQRSDRSVEQASFYIRNILIL